jgi:hemerythrin-like domain-containing protein
MLGEQSGGRGGMNIDKFKREHVDLLAAVTTLRELVQTGVQEHAEAIVGQLVSMSSVIKLHLAAEDRVLYPALINAADPRVAQTGQQFQQEMGDLAQAYTGFVSRWNLASKISQDPEGFRGDANNVFKALHLRVQRENRELYPLAEQL